VTLRYPHGLCGRGPLRRPRLGRTLRNEKPGFPVDRPHRAIPHPLPPMTPLTRRHGLAIARRFRTALLSKGYPVQRVLLYGSVARDQAGEDSDLDIAVLCEPFAATRHEENMALRKVRRDIDVRISPFCLHPDDFDNPA